MVAVANFPLMLLKPRTPTTLEVFFSLFLPIIIKTYSVSRRCDVRFLSVSHLLTNG